MDNYKEIKEKALRIFKTICEDFDSAHYSSCVNVIKKNRQILSSALTPEQEQKIDKIYAFSVFTIIEDLYLAGQIDSAIRMQNQYTNLLSINLPHNEKKLLEEYKNGNIEKQKISNKKDILDSQQEDDSDSISENQLDENDATTTSADSITTDDVSSNEENLNQSKNVDNSDSWTMVNTELEAILKKNDAKKKRKKVLKIIIALIAIISTLALYKIGFINMDSFLNIPTTSDVVEVETSVDLPKELEVIEAPAPPPISEVSEDSIDGETLTIPNVSVDENGYVLPSDNRLLVNDDIVNFDQKAIRLAINEMFARKGFAFNNTGDYYNFFCQFSWYEPNPDITVDEAEALFSETEKTNLFFLLNNEG